MSEPTPDVRFHPSQLSKLVEGLTAHWPRRGRTLLELGCGDGLVLDMVWNSGFDVTGLDADPDALRSAIDRFQGRAEFHLGTWEDAPYDDHAFDYVIALTVLFSHEQVNISLLAREAVRLASRGVLFVFPNKWSLWRGAALCAGRMPLLVPRRFRPEYPVDLPVYNPLAVRRTIRGISPAGRLKMRSFLPGPLKTWNRSSFFWRHANNRLLYGPFGAFAALRLDISPPVSVTGLPLRVNAVSMPLADTAPLAHAAQPASHSQTCESKPVTD